MTRRANRSVIARLPVPVGASAGETERLPDPRTVLADVFRLPGG